jgi:ParB family chromosome partitioning protein
MADIRAQRLGKGLAALISTNEDGNTGVMNRKFIEDFDVEKIVPNPYQPRMHINPQRLMELADSIREHGVIQPLIITKDKKTDQYFIVAGERRYRAVKLAGFTTIPVVIKETSPLEMLQLALIENIQREDLNPLEEAFSYKQLITEFGLSQSEIAKKVGLNRVTIANKIRLYNLPDKIKELVLNNSLSEGHARALLGVKDETSMIAAADIVVKRGLSVRQTEALVRKIMFGKSDVDRNWRTMDEQTKACESYFAKKFDAKVRVLKMSKGGKIVIRYRTHQDLDRIMDQVKALPSK